MTVPDPTRSVPRAPAVILAAGRGSRLSAAHRVAPKWLLSVRNNTIADCHLQALSHCGRVSGVTVVTGYRADAIDEYLGDLDAGITVKALWNEHFATKNNWFSLQLALEALGSGVEETGFVLLNSDFWALPLTISSFIEETVEEGRSTSLAVDFDRPLTDEAMKVATDQRRAGRVLDIGKVGLGYQASGEYVGMAWISPRLVPALKDELSQILSDASRQDDWYEGALKRLVMRGEVVNTWPMPDTVWSEIDSDLDLLAVRSIR